MNRCWRLARLPRPNVSPPGVVVGVVSSDRCCLATTARRRKPRRGRRKRRNDKEESLTWPESGSLVQRLALDNDLEASPLDAGESWHHNPTLALARCWTDSSMTVGCYLSHKTEEPRPVDGASGASPTTASGNGQELVDRSRPLLHLDQTLDDRKASQLNDDSVSNVRTDESPNPDSECAASMADDATSKEEATNDNQRPWWMSQSSN